MTKLEISLLGGFDILVDGTLLTAIKTQKAKALFAYLLMHPAKSFSRGVLATLLWPEQSAEKSSHSLRQALSTLRKNVPETAGQFIVNRFEISFAPSAQINIDVFQFQNLVSANEQTSLGLSIYKGPFLDGFAPNASAEFETWMLGQREELQAKFLISCLRIAP
ncbi:MAG: winged helix-turn-helix domain-containing protein [Chloroflexota bacterium]